MKSLPFPTLFSSLGKRKLKSPLPLSPQRGGANGTYEEGCGSPSSLPTLKSSPFSTTSPDRNSSVRRSCLAFPPPLLLLIMGRVCPFPSGFVDFDRRNVFLQRGAMDPFLPMSMKELFFHPFPLMVLGLCWFLLTRTRRFPPFFSFLSLKRGRLGPPDHKRVDGC